MRTHKTYVIYQIVEKKDATGVVKTINHEMHRSTDKHESMKMFDMLNRVPGVKFFAQVYFS